MNLRPAYNTGFKPETINMKSGFKPILTKELQDRIDDDEPQIEPNSEVGVINLDDTRFESKIESFEPMFVPSPTDKTTKIKRLKIRKRPLKKKPYKIIIQTKSLKDSDMEPIAEANERVEAYYLPPTGQKPVEILARHRSNIDIEAPASSKELAGSPPAVVVTFDGRKLSGSSLTIDPFSKSNVVNQRGTKAQEYVKAGPQSVPFKGDLPPLDGSGLAFKNVGEQNRNQRVLHRELESPPPAPENGKTKLRRVRREKREAHHTPEHTAEQERQRMNETAKSRASGGGSVGVWCFVVAGYVLKYLY